MGGLQTNPTTTQRIFSYDAFPGWARFPTMVEPYINAHGQFAVLDIGGGANPMVSPEIARKITYTLLDIDPSELAKAPPVYNRLVCADATMSPDEFAERVGTVAYDLVYSHMFLEHVRSPDAIHRNIFAALKPGGVCIHAYPSRHNIPLALNGALPESVSRLIVRALQPQRDLNGNVGKFPAFYRQCLPPSKQANSYFEGFGYEVVRHDGFAGHTYYGRIPVARNIERLTRKLVVLRQLRWICFNLVVLRRPA